MRVIERDLPLFPLGQMVLFPGMVVPLHVFEDRYRAMIGTCQVTDKLFGILLIRSGQEVGAPADPEDVGCTARISQLDRLPDGRMYLLATGEQRFRLLDRPVVQTDGYLVGRARIVEEEDADDVPPDLLEQVVSRFRMYQDALSQLRAERGKGEKTRDVKDLSGLDAPVLSFQAAAALHIQPRERQSLLELDDTARRLRRILRLLKRETETLQLLTRVPPGNTMMGPFSRN